MSRIFKIDVTKLPWEAVEDAPSNNDIIDELKENGISSDQEAGLYYILAQNSEEALKRFEAVDIETLEGTGIDTNDSDEDTEEDHKENIHNI